MKRASFISIEDEGVDLILSFALEDQDLGVRGLILIRTPAFESIMPEEERGVKVSLEGHTKDGEDSLLVKAVLSDKGIAIATHTEKYNIDLSKVDKDELKNLYPFLQKMNFDGKFELSHA